jgi:transcriptional regulator with XRE-family HTH domain
MYTLYITEKIGCQPEKSFKGNFMENIVRKLRGNLSQAALAKMAGMPQSTLADLELIGFPKLEKLERIAAAVGKKVEWVIKDNSAREDKK